MKILKFKFSLYISLTASFSILAGFIPLYPQQTFMVRHLEGTQTVHNIKVTVIPLGKIAILEDLDYCNGETGPYYFGYSYIDYKSENGGYTFIFDPPAKEIIVNVTGLSADNENMEEVTFYVNGVHYPIPAAGAKIDCELMAVLTPKGNIRPCRDCSISGWKGTKIPGPVKTFMVTDSVISGNPAGSLIALYISEPEDYVPLIRIPESDIIAGKGIIIRSQQFQSFRLGLMDAEYNTLNFYYEQVDAEHIHLTSAELVRGEYILEIIKSGVIVEKQKIIVE